MSESILSSIKKNRGLTDAYEVFDPDIIMLINTAFSTLCQLGCGPKTGFSISGYDETWDDFLEGDTRLNMVKTYVDMKVHLAFDPPQIGAVMSALQEQIKELEWRINVAVDPGGIV